MDDENDLLAALGRSPEEQAALRARLPPGFAPAADRCVYHPELAVPTARAYWARLGAAERRALGRLFLPAEALRRVAAQAQRSPEWLEAHRGRVSSSNAGKIAGHVDYGAAPVAARLAEELLSTVPRVLPASAVRNMRYGTVNEDRAVAQFEAETRARLRRLVALARAAGEAQFRYVGESFAVPAVDVPDAELCCVRVPGFEIHPVQQWVGDSGDGVVWVLGRAIAALEVKCPAAKKLYDLLPLSHLDQVQVHMFVLGQPRCFLYVWCASRSYCDVHDRDEAYLQAALLPVLRRFFFEELLPRLALADEKNPPPEANR